MPKIQAACTVPLKDGLVGQDDDREGPRVARRRRWSSSSSTIRSTARSATRPASARSRTTPSATGQQLSQLRRDASASTRASTARMIGPHVIADMTRCIQCTRCIRFCQEIAGTGELTFLDRGGRTLVWTHEGKPLANDWSACAADVCPVGALTVKEFRFRSRVWYLDKTPLGLPRLQRRLQHLDRVEGRRRLSLPPPLQPGRQRLLALRLRPVPVREPERPRRPEGHHPRAATTCGDAIVPEAIALAAREIRATLDKTGPSGPLLPRLRPPLERGELPPPQDRRPPRLLRTATSSSTSRRPARSSSRTAGSRATKPAPISAAPATWACRPAKAATASTPSSPARRRPRSSSWPTPTSPRRPTIPRRSRRCAARASSSSRRGPPTR